MPTMKQKMLQCQRESDNLHNCFAVACAEATEHIWKKSFGTALHVQQCIYQFVPFLVQISVHKGLSSAVFHLAELLYYP